MTERNTKLPEHTIAFATIYNIEVPSSLLGVEFGGYKIMTLTSFVEMYPDSFQTFAKSGLYFLESEIRGINPIKYIIVLCGSSGDYNNVDEVDDVEDPQILCNMLLNTLFYCRLAQSGDLQFGTIIVVKKDGRVERFAEHTDFACFKPEIIYYKYIYKHETYKVTKNLMDKILLFSKSFEEKFEEKIPEVYDAAWFFTRAHNTSDILYKIINLVTVIERLVSEDGENGEIAFKIRARLNFLMEKNFDFISKIYTIRSKILHKGDIVGYKKGQYAPEKLYEYYHKLDEICRNLINYFINKFIKEGKEKISDVFKEFDENMFKYLAKPR